MGITIIVAVIVLFVIFRTVSEDKKRKQELVEVSAVQTDESVKKESKNKWSLLSYKGRMVRSTYFWTFACVNIGIVILNIIFEDILQGKWWILQLIYGLFSTWILYVTTMKRCHDMGQSGWFALIPFYYIVLFFLKGQEKDNQYGENPYKENKNEWI